MKFRSIKNTKLTFGAFLLLCIFFQMLFLFHAGAVDPVIYRHDRLSIGIKEMPLEQVLRKVAEQAGFEIVFYDALNMPVTMAFENIALEKGLKKLLFNCNFSFQYQKAVHGGKEGIVLTKVVVFSKNATGFPVETNAVRNTHLPAMTENELRPPSMQDIQPTPMAAENEKQRVGSGVFLKVGSQDILMLSQTDITQDIQSRTASLTLGLSGGPDLREADQAVPKMEGLEITYISTGSILNKLGLKRGDVVQDINGVRTTSPEQMAQALRTGVSETGGALRIEVERGDRIEPIYVEIGSPEQ